MPDTAMVLAAGLGTRMRPLTDNCPKPLINVAGKPLIDYALDRFAAAGVSSAVVNVHYLPEMLEEHLKERTTPRIIISDERDALLETGGGLKKAHAHLGDAPLFCTNTDAIIIDTTDDEACAILANFWNAEEMDALLLLIPRSAAHGYDGRGDFDRDSNGRLNWRNGETANYVFTGLQIISPRLLHETPDGAFSTKLLWEKAQRSSRMFGVVHNGAWLHVGDPQSLKLAEEFLRDVGK